MASEQAHLVDQFLTLAEHLSSGADLRGRLSSVCRAATELTRCCGSRIFVLAADGYHLAYSSRPQAEAAPGPQIVPADDPVVAEAARTRGCVLARAAAAPNLLDPEAPTSAGVRSLVVAPLLDEAQQPLGLLVAEYSAPPDAFSAVMARVVLGLAKLAELAVVADRRNRQHLEAEELLRRREEHFRALIKHGSDIITILSADGVIRYQSPSFERVLGYAPEDMIGTNALDHIHPDDAPRVLRTLTEGLAAGLRQASVEYRLQHKDGSWRILESIGNNQLDDPEIKGIIVTSRDVTERRRTEEALRESEARLRLIVDQIPAVLWTTDTELLFTSNAGRVATVLNGTGRYKHSPTLYEFFQTDDPEFVPIREHRRVLQGESATFDLQWGERVYHSHVEPLRDTHGTIVGTIGVALDVTESKRAEAEKAGLLDLASDISGTLDLAQILDRVQRRAASLLPCDSVLTFYWDPRREVFRMISQHGVPEELLPAAAALEFQPGQPLTEQVVGGQTVLINGAADQSWVPAGLLARFQSRAAVVAPLLVRGRMLGALVAVNAIDGRQFDARQVQLFEGIGRHVAVALEASELYRTQQEEAQIDAALAKVGRELIASLKMPALLERLCQLSTEVLGCDYSCTLLWRPEDNAYVLAAMHGATAEEWEAVRVLKLSRETMSAFLDQLEREEVVQVNTSLMTPVVAERLAAEYGISVSLHVALRRGDEMIGFHCAGYRGRSEPFTPQQLRIARGTAQLASLALETARLLEELERASNLKSEFVATMSHELRTPLNIILGYSDLMLEDAFGKLAPEQADTLQRMEKSARELLELINATLDLSRLEAGRMPLEVRETCVHELIHEVATETRPLQEKAGFDLVCHVPPSLPPLHTDPLKLKVVLKNLVVNALKFTDQGSVMLDVYSHDGGLEFCVADTGIGMSPEALPVIFEPFRQVDGFKTRRQGGVGLGLYIVRRLLDMMGGSISVDSEVGRGSVFRVWVPNQMQAAAESRAQRNFDA